jgi:membrane protein
MPFGVSWKRFLHDLYAKLNDDNVFNGAAALGFYLTLAIFPAMIAMMAVLPYLPIARVDLAIMDLLHQTLPPSAAEMFSEVVKDVTSERRGGVLSFGIAAALWAASTGMYAIMQQLNITYDVKEARSFLRARAVALALTLLVGFLLLSALSLVVMGGVIQDWIGNRFGFSTALLTFFAVLRWVIIAVALLAALALVYWLAPNVEEQRFRFITPGSIVGALLLILASVGFTLYTTSFADYDATYGSIGAVIVLMLWLYIAGLVMLLGSEINVLKERYAPEGKREGERRAGERGDTDPGGVVPPRRVARSS